MARTITFSTDEWYHCFSRGVDKRKIFLSKADYERFLMLMYVCNSTTPLHLSSLVRTPVQGRALNKVLEQERGEPLVDIGAYALMPNHYHLLLSELVEGGLSEFMHRVGTGYTMYFNKKYARTGALFSSRFKARHVATDQYFRRVVNYIHGNPAELYVPTWKDGIIPHPRALYKNLSTYPYSSFPDYEDERSVRNLAVLINKERVLAVLDEPLTFEQLIEDQRELHAKEEREATSIEPVGFE